MCLDFSIMTYLKHDKNRVAAYIITQLSKGESHRKPLVE